MRQSQTTPPAILTALRVPHFAAALPDGGYAFTFGHYLNAARALAILASAGYRVTAVGPRGLHVAAPVKAKLGQRHPRTVKGLKISLLILILPVPHLSAPVYLFLGIRWYRRTRPSLPFRIVRTRNTRFYA